MGLAGKGVAKFVSIAASNFRGRQRVTRVMFETCFVSILKNINFSYCKVASKRGEILGQPFPKTFTKLQHQVRFFPLVQGNRARDHS